ncbi:toxin [Kibdelosporangium philippinense]|uniref:Toxin n=1 Tax=Kibdelosporangium philippinense TaxID=211113 RepID=A0ABS8ZSB2_9PSEU|nr:toxin [Kibdelosporangium philippinense]MCE7010123.1 toxin [Kibdelosporangium philippinense]
MVSQLALPETRDVQELCHSVGERRGRPIVLMAVPMSASGACGLWMAGAGVDYICYERETTPVHQDHIVLHELGHILCEHPGSEPVEQALATIFPDLSDATLKIMLARQHAGFSDQHEAEAETMAYLISEKIDTRPRRTHGELTEMSDRLSQALEP